MPDWFREEEQLVPRLARQVRPVDDAQQLLFTNQSGIGRGLHTWRTRCA